MIRNTWPRDLYTGEGGGLYTGTGGGLYTDPGGGAYRGPGGGLLQGPVAGSTLGPVAGSTLDPATNPIVAIGRQEMPCWGISPGTTCTILRAFFDRTGGSCWMSVDGRH